MKQISLFIPLLGTLLLSGCAGTNSDFECDATTSDTCMTMEQANEKAKKLEQSSEAKPVAASLPRLAEGNFRTMPVQTVTATTPSGSRPAVTAHPGNDSNLLIVFYVQIMPDDFVMQLHRF